jgi:hypothetical protein
LIDANLGEAKSKRICTATVAARTGSDETTGMGRPLRDQATHEEEIEVRIKCSNVDQNAAIGKQEMPHFSAS